MKYVSGHPSYGHVYGEWRQGITLTRKPLRKNEESMKTSDIKDQFKTKNSADG